MKQRVLILAAENGALPGGKVGGIGDVIRDLPPAIAANGSDVTVMTPGYGRLADAGGLSAAGTITTTFAGRAETGRVSKRTEATGVMTVVIDHPALDGTVYVDDHEGRPFATDASRFALFSALAGRWLAQNDVFDVIHLHDWHVAPLLLLRAYDPAYAHLAGTRFVFTIHNLAMQGIRPLRDDASALFTWFPDLLIDSFAIDPRWTDCVNLLRAGIRLADAVNTVSPGYATEIRAEDSPASEGLGADLAAVGVTGILNGCSYPSKTPGVRRASSALLTLARQTVLDDAARYEHARSAHLVALERIPDLKRRRPPILVTSVGRLTDQKMGILREPVDGKPALHHLLDSVGKRGAMLFLGTGDAANEQFLTGASASYANCLFVRGFSEALADDLYRSGQLFLMPSSFEPCGLSQMFAMRGGQPCLVHATGGLKDTVTEGDTGWVFSGASRADQARALITTFESAFDAAATHTPEWERIATRAAKVRFTWADSAHHYEALYRGQVEHMAEVR